MRREAAHLLMVGGLSACGGGNVRGPEPGVAEGLPCPDGLLLHTAGPAAPWRSGFSRRQRLVRRCFLEKPLLCCVIAPHVGEACHGSACPLFGHVASAPPPQSADGHTQQSAQRIGHRSRAQTDTQLPEATQ